MTLTNVTHGVGTTKMLLKSDFIRGWNDILTSTKFDTMRGPSYEYGRISCIVSGRKPYSLQTAIHALCAAVNSGAINAPFITRRLNPYEELAKFVRKPSPKANLETLL